MPPVTRLSILVLLLAMTTMESVSGHVGASAAVGGSTCDGVPATIVGTNEADVLRGTPGPDVIVALRGDDEVAALDGDDLVCGGPGIDLIELGRGEDTAWGGADRPSPGQEGDQIRPGPGDDVVHGGIAPDEAPGTERRADWVLYSSAERAVTVTLPGSGVAGTARGQGDDVLEGIFSVVGTKHDDTIVAGAESHVVSGQAGKDVLTVDSDEGAVRGGLGDDVIRGGEFVYGGYGDDRIIRARNDAFGGYGDDVFIGSHLRNEFYGYKGNDRVRGRGGRDYLMGHDGDDLLIGGKGRDQADGGRGRDTCVAEVREACEA